MGWLREAKLTSLNMHKTDCCQSRCLSVFESIRFQATLLVTCLDGLKVRASLGVHVGEGKTRVVKERLVGGGKCD